MRVFFCTIVMLSLGCASPPPASPAPATSHTYVAARTPAEILLDKQIVAYNARDIDTLVNTCAPDVRVYNHPNELQYSGRDELRQRYMRLFAKAPNVHGVSVRRIVYGNFVVDEAHVTGLPDGTEKDLMGIFEIRDQQVVAAWFFR